MGQDKANRIKILFVIGTLAIGGTERQLVELATNLDRRRFDPVVCCLSSGGPLERSLVDHGIRVEVIGFRGLSLIRHGRESMGSLFRLVRFMSRERPTIVHGFLFWAYVLGAFAARLIGVPIVVASRRSLGNFKERKPHYLALERVANWTTDLIIANSDAVRRDVLRQEHVPPQKIVVVHNGVRIPALNGAHRRGMPISLAQASEAPLVGVVANFIHYKGHAVFLEAWRVVVAKIPGAVALLVGDGEMRAHLEQLVNDLDLGTSVQLLGTRSDIPSLLNVIDLLVHPSLEEGFSNAILEAMAAGKPVVATAVGGNPEAVVDGDTGILVPAGNAEALASAIIKLLGDRQMLSAFGAAGRRRVSEQFDLNRMVARYETIYEELLCVRYRGTV